MLDVDFPKFWERVAPMVVGISGVSRGVSELLQAIYTNPLGICCGFAAGFKLNFGFSILQFGRNGGPYGGGPSLCQMGRQ